MQNDTAYGGHATSATPQSHTDDAVFASLYSAIFYRKASVSQYDVESDHSSSSAHRHRQLYNSLLVQDHQEMVNRHQETSEEADALRRENVHLRSLNLELNKHLSLLIHASVQKQFGSPSSVQTTAPFGIVNGLHGMKIDDKRAEQDMSDESPMSVIESEGGDAKNIDVERFSLPKSISVRSDGYVKAAQAAQAGASTAQIKEGRSLKSLSVWLKFLFQNPTSCGCSLSVDGDRIVTQHKRKRDCDSSWPADVAVHKRYFRGWLIRSCFSCQRRAKTKIKSAIPHRQAEVEFQWIVRGQNSRNRLIGASSLLPVVCNGCPLNSTGSLYMGASHIRGWFARQKATGERQCIVVIQSCWRGYLATQIEEETYDHHTEDSVRKFKAIQAWWQDMAERNHRSVAKPTSPTLLNLSTNKDNISIEKVNTDKVNYEGGSIVTHDISASDLVKAAIVVQRYIRGWLARLRYIHGVALVDKSCNLCQENNNIALDLQVRAENTEKSNYEGGSIVTHDISAPDLVKAAIVVQRYIRGWLVRLRYIHGVALVDKSCNLCQENNNIALDLQVRAENTEKSNYEGGSIVTQDISAPDLVKAAIVLQRYIRGWLARLRLIHGVALVDKSGNLCQESVGRDLQVRAAVKIQLAWKNFSVCHSLLYQLSAATKIQSHFRGWLLRRRFHIKRQAIIRIQSVYQMSRCWKAYQQYKIAAGSATVIQSYIRGCFARKGAENHRLLIVAIQRYFRGWLIRSQFSCQRQAAIKIQSAIQGLIWRQSFHCHRQAAVEIQRIVRGQISRNRLLGAASLRPIVRNGCPLNSTGALYMGDELNKVVCSVLKLQRWWRSVMSLNLTNSAVIIQSHIRPHVPTTRSHGQSCAPVRASHKGGLGGGARAGDGGLVGAGKGTRSIRPNKGGGGAGGGGGGAGGGGGGAGVVKRIIKARRPYRRIPLCRRDTSSDTERQLLMMRLWRYRSSGDIVNEVRAGLGGCRVTDKVVFKVNNLQEISAAEVDVNGGIAYLDSHLVRVVAVCQLYGKLRIECYWMVGGGSGRRQKHEIHRETCQTMDRLMDHIHYITRFVCQFDGKIDLSFTMTEDGPDGEPLKLEGFQTHVDNSDSWAGAFRGVGSINAKFSSTAAEDGNGDVPPA